MRIKTNDIIVVLRGRDRNKRGKILKSLPDEQKVVVEKLNMVKKHLKPTKAAPHGGIQEIELPIPISAVMLICPHCNKPTRIASKLSGERENVRICRNCHEMIDVKK